MVKRCTNPSSVSVNRLPITSAEVMSVVEVRAYRAALPVDDRTEMQKLLGEPEFHRSALFSKQQART